MPEAIDGRRARHIADVSQTGRGVGPVVADPITMIQTEPATEAGIP